MPIIEKACSALDRIRSLLSWPDPRLLCMWCGGIGHKPTRCPTRHRRGPTRETLKQLAEEVKGNALCEPCRLRWPGIIALFAQDDPHSPPGSSPSYRFTRKTYGLGPIADLILDAHCPLCRLIFALAPWKQITATGKRRHEIRLIQAWTPEWLGLSAKEVDQIQSYSSCVTSKICKIPWSDDPPPVDSFPFRDQETAVIIPAAKDSSAMLCGRHINPEIVDSDIIKSWLRRCEVHHPRSCTPAWEEAQRQMKLIDVNSCQVVPYPTSGRVDYTALSYVWGDVTKESYQVGCKVQHAPKTITDAMTITRRLGKDYVWVDAICIDQYDEQDVSRQVKLMHAIYSGAWVTLVALAGDSAYYGLPRVSSAPGKAVNGGHARWTCSHGGITLATALSSLETHIGRSKWATRGWTFQEGILSPRCLYFTEEQAFYRCNVLEACESLDDSNSHPHSMQDSGKDSLKQGFDHSLTARILTESVENLPGAMEMMRNRLPEFFIDDGIYLYRELIDDYARRALSQDRDSIRACSGILDRLQKRYLHSGFFWGIPRDDFKESLLWTHSFGSQTRRRPDFPSWSWAGWEGSILYYDNSFEAPQPYVQLFEIRDGQRVPVQAYSTQDSPFPADYAFIPEEETIFQSTRAPGSTDSADLDRAEREGMLLVDGVLITVLCGYQYGIGLRKRTKADKGMGFIWNPLDGTRVHFDEGFMEGGIYDCLLIGWAQDEDTDEMCLEFLMLSWDGEIAYREGVMTIPFPDEFWQRNVQFRLETFFLG
ncbi:hypothetical protein CDV36_012632 [Fusarium kuroshium]|uniref:Heterokaryon incompatibility domain-containing protein n=1 Tax=Fusarium kuroshium TaxID=2010991 RepID=A0A3M2RR02_9HYPO|nr:hypothetical protein CDV36_012632 [Fusarium kuroshium]